MVEALIPMIVCTGMFAMIFGIVYLKSRENLALIEKGINPKVKNASPKPFGYLKWGAILIGSGLGLLFAFIIDNTLLKHNNKTIEKRIIAKNGVTNLDSLEQEIKKDSGNKITKTINVESMDEDTNADTDEDHHYRHNGGEIHFEAGNSDDENVAIYFALIAIGGGLGLMYAYRIEKKEWLDKRSEHPVVHE